MTPPSSDTLLQHLGRLYAFAQLATPDPVAAARLVRSTYERVFEHGVAVPEGEATRLYLYRVLLDVRREERGEPPMTPLDDVRLHDAPGDLSASRERHGERLVDLHLPPALVSLDTSERLLLLLCDVEGLPCTEAAHVLGVPESVACDHYAAARETLKRRMLASVSVHERAMTEELLTDDRLRRGILTALQEELAPVPPTLRTQIDPPAPPPLPDTSEASPVNRWIRAGYIALVLVIVGLSAFLLLRRPHTAEERNLIFLAAREAPEVAIAVQTSDALEVQRFVETHLGWRLSLPDIRGYKLQGAGLDDIVEGVSVPVFRYTSDSLPPVTLYAFTYALLDQTAQQVGFELDVLRELENDQHFDLHNIRGSQVLAWRSRDDVYLAVTPTLAPDLAQRITP